VALLLTGERRSLLERRADDAGATTPPPRTATPPRCRPASRRAASLMAHREAPNPCRESYREPMCPAPVRRSTRGIRGIRGIRGGTGWPSHDRRPDGIRMRWSGSITRGGAARAPSDNAVRGAVAQATGPRPTQRQAEGRASRLGAIATVRDLMLEGDRRRRTADPTQDLPPSARHCASGATAPGVHRRSIISSPRSRDATRRAVAEAASHGRLVAVPNDDDTATPFARRSRRPTARDVVGSLTATAAPALLKSFGQRRRNRSPMCRKPTALCRSGCGGVGCTPKTCGVPDAFVKLQLFGAFADIGAACADGRRVGRRPSTSEPAPTHPNGTAPADPQQRPRFQRARRSRSRQ
jgi:hypothetical protein